MAAVMTPPEISSPPAAKRRNGRVNLLRWSVLGLAAIYFIMPMGAAVWFALYNPTQGFSLHAFTGMFGLPNFTSSFLMSVWLSVFSVVMTLAIMVPTTLIVHLKLPGMRKAIELACLLPLVVPPVVLAVGVSNVLGWGPRGLAGTPFQSLINWLQNSTLPGLGLVPAILVFTYVIMALPFTYRALDAGLRTSNVTSLVEAARSLGASWPTLVRRVVVPALKTSILNAAFLAFALAFGEFTVASMLQYLTLTPWMLQYNNYDGQLAVGVSILLLVITWGFLMIITALGRTKSAKD